MIVGSAKRESIEKTVCLSCVKEGYHAPRQGFLKGIALEATGHEEGERGGYGKGGWAVRRREREREREGPEAGEGRTPGGSWKKAGGKPGRREGEAEEKNGEGGGCLVGDCGGDAGVPARQKNNGPSYEDGPLEIKSWRCSTFPRKNAQYHRRWRA